MNRYLTCLLLALLSFGCGKQHPEEQLQHINGYWEIEKVEFSRDSVKEFRINENIDYIEIRGKEGFRTKVRPNFDGSFKAGGELDKVEAEIKNDSLYLHYSTPYDTWTETVISAGENRIIIKNKDGIVYHYKRYEPLLSDPDETQ